MKNVYSIFMIAAAVATVFSCSKAENVEPSQPEKTPIVIKGYTDVNVTSGNKSSLEGVSVLWNTNDQVAAFDAAGTKVATSSSTAVSSDQKTAEFAFADYENPNFASLLYPAEAAGDQVGTITIPTEQAATENSFANGANVAFAKVEDGDIKSAQFKNLGGLLSIKINNDDIASVELSANEVMTGAGTLNTETLAATPATDGEKRVVLNGGLVNGTEYYAVVYPGSYTGLKIVITDNQGRTATYTNSRTLSVSRNANLSIATLTVPDSKWVSPVTEKYYVKVTSDADLTDGDYLIVYEVGKVAFNGGLETLDAASNTIDVTLNDDKIKSTDAVDAAKFTIDASAGTIKSASGYYIGQTSDANGMASSTSTAYENNISISDDANIVSGGAYLRYNSASNQLRFRYYKSASYTGQQPIALYKLEDDRQAIATPTNLQVSDMTLSWDAVSDAANYSVKIGDVIATIEGTSYTFEGEADYYNVSVVAYPSDPTNYKASAPATLTDAKFGTPTLPMPSLERGVVNETSIEVLWTNDPRAIDYHASLYKDESQIKEVDGITSGSVVFSNLDQNTTYIIKVYAKATSGEKAYAASNEASLLVKTDETVTIAKILSEGETDSITLPISTVMAKQGKYTVLSDETGNILVYNPTGSHAIGDIVKVTGAITTYSNAYQFSSATITKISDGSTNYPSENLIDTEAPLVSYAQGEAGSARVIYATLRGRVESGNIVIGSKTIATYNNLTSLNNKDVEAKGYLTGWYNTNIYFVVVSAEEYIDPNAPTMVIDPESLALSWIATESGSEKAKTITVTLNEAASGYNVSYTDTDNAWTVSDNESGTITIYPNEANSSTTADKVLNITISHKDDNSLSSTIILKQQKKSNGGTYSLTPNQESTGSSATTYITTLTEFTYNGISWKMNQWNPKSLQIKTNQGSAASEFRFYNTSAFSGRIAKVVIKFDTLNVLDASKLMFVGGTAEVTSTTGGTAGVWDSTTKTLTWTPSSSDNFTFFAFYQNGKAASGNNYLADTNAIVVTYE